MRSLIVGLVLLTGVQTASAQGIGIFLHHDRLAEYGAGFGLNVLSRGPWIAKDFRKPVIRLVGVQITSYAYERLFDYNGFSWNDYRQRLYGYLVTETVIEGGRWIWHQIR